MLVFTQRWPITGCMEWMDKSKNHECILPSQRGIWTIHGVWPTRFGSIGPQFCTKGEFNITELDQLKNELDQFWINIEKGIIFRLNYLFVNTFCMLIINI